MLVLITLNSIMELGAVIKITVSESINSSTDAIQVVGVMMQVVHVLEYFILLCSFCTCKRQKNPQNLPTKYFWAMMILTFFVIYSSVFLTPPILYTTLRGYSLSFTPNYVSCIFSVTSFVTHISTAVIRVAMIGVTLLVRNVYGCQLRRKVHY